MKYESCRTACIVIASLAAIAIAAGCSRPTAPTGDPSSARTAYAAADTATLLWLVFDARLAEPGRKGVLLRRPSEFALMLPGAPELWPRADTIPAHSSLKRVEWWRKDSLGWSLVRAPIGTVRFYFGADTVDTGNLPPTILRTRIQRPAELGGGRITFWVFVGLAPSEWWAGPDPSRWPRSPDGDGRAVDLREWPQFTTRHGTWPPDGRGWFGPDSFAYRLGDRRPVERNGERRTFWEMRGNRVWARSEGDTVRLGSTLVFSMGGFDPDSPYLPHVAEDPALPAGGSFDSRRYEFLRADGVVGSPIAMRFTVRYRTLEGSPGAYSETGSQPWFDAASIYRRPTMHHYFRPVYAGKYYVSARAEDGDRQLGRPAFASSYPFHEAVDRVDAGGGSAYERAERPRVLVFHVRP